MRKVDIISPVYKNKKVNFDGFILNFDIDGKASIQIEDNQIEKFDNVLNSYPNIYKGTKLPDSVVFSIKKEQEDKENKVKLDELNFFKNKNIELAKENAILKKENERLVELNKTLQQKMKDSFKNKEEDKEIKENKVEDKKEEPSKNLNNLEVDKEEDKEVDFAKELNSKNLSQIKELLNSEFGDFKDEWSKLTKKDDLINYILKKIEAEQ